MFIRRLRRGLAVVAAAVLGFAPPPAPAGVIFGSDALPPFGSTYAGNGVHMLFDTISAGLPFNIVITDPRHNIPSPNTRCYPPPPTAENCLIPIPVGGSRIHIFDSQLSFTITGVDAAGHEVPGVTTEFTDSTVEVTTELKRLADVVTVQIFELEILSMLIDGTAFGRSVLVREDQSGDPLRASKGQATIEPLSGGLFRIDSFFDVFTELSIDGGLTWIPSDTSGRVRLVSEPSMPAVAGLALLVLACTRRAGERTARLRQAR